MSTQKTIAMFAVLCLIALGLGYWVGQPKQTSRKENGGNPEGKWKVKSEVASKEPEFLKKGLVAYYPFNGNAKDESGNGHDGEVKGAVLTADRHGKPDKAYSFDGNHYVQGSSMLPDENSITMAGWLYVNEITGARQFCIFEGDDAWGLDLFICITEIGHIGFGTKDNNLLITDFAISVGKWHHFTCVADASKNKKSIWIDGLKAKEDSRWAGPANVGNHYQLAFGGLADGLRTLDLLAGQLDDMRIYNRALSEAEVKALYEWEKVK